MTLVAVTETERIIDKMKADRQAATDRAMTMLGGAEAMFTVLAESVEDIDPFRDSELKAVYIRPASAGNLESPADKPGDLDVTKNIADLLAAIGVAPRPYSVGDVGSLTPIAIRDFDREAPDFNLPANVDTTLPDAPTAPTINAVATVALSTVVIPPAPTLDTIAVPNTPVFAALPDFTYSIPELAIEAPSPVLNYSEQAYQSDLFDAAQAKLLADIQSGGTGLNPDVEQAIFDRAKSRELEEHRINLVETADEFAAGGFPKPTGALHASMRKLRNNMVNRAEVLSREVMVKQAELAQRNTEFIMDKSLQADGMLREHFNRVADRALQVARATIEYAVSVFNTKISAHNLKLEQLKTEGAIYEIRAKASLQAIEYHRAELEAAKLRGDLQQNELEKYKMEIQGVEAVIRMQTLQMDQAKAAADIERLKLDIFKGQIEGFSAQLRAKEAEYSIYGAKIDAEKAKQQGFASQVEAFRATLDAKRSMIDAEKTVMTGKIEKERLRLEQSRGEMDIYNTKSQAVMRAVDAAIAEHSEKNSTYRANIELAVRRLAGEQFDATLSQQVNQFNAESESRRLEAQLRGMEALTKMKMDGAHAGFSSVSGITTALLNQFVDLVTTAGSLTKTE